MDTTNAMDTAATTAMKASERILLIIKTHGPQTTQALALALEMTSMGARRHLQAWVELGCLAFDDRQEGIGRPTRHWRLTEAGHRRFPDRHGDLTLQLIQQVKSVFGDAGLTRLIDVREAQAHGSYQARMAAAARDLPAQLAALVAVRQDEGYMAEISQAEDGSWLLIENHCPICAAATQCQQFCRSELSLFQQLLGSQAQQVQVSREEHILSGARRCAYRVRQN